MQLGAIMKCYLPHRSPTSVRVYKLRKGSWHPIDVRISATAIERVDINTGSLLTPPNLKHELKEMQMLRQIVACGLAVGAEHGRMAGGYILELLATSATRS